ncbi:hypothetical protein CY34DRAFT_807653 [Suillus luteus UH-Slu-Lm8-n1]|uniref:Uncharacterized protein n=1 Tax=Suillus luteus UH-Slu-Lm8-n1 TaxID=930992 RepID=A0A0D0APT5_9AGAM|nr:hypothetical protein CY34DRAFT_807653 [Suillus luteus UH-Slu-Lm8-n1]
MSCSSQAPQAIHNSSRWTVHDVVLAKGHHPRSSGFLFYIADFDPVAHVPLTERDRFGP